MDSPFPDSVPLTSEMIAEADAEQAASAHLSPYKFVALSNLVEIPLD